MRKNHMRKNLEDESKDYHFFSYKYLNGKLKNKRINKFNSDGVVCDTKNGQYHERFL